MLPMRSSHRSLFRAVSATLLAVAVSGASGQSQAQASRSRITAAIDNGNRVTLAHSKSARAVAAFDRGPVESSFQLQGLELSFTMSDTQQTDLGSLLAAQQDPSSALYHQWLTPTQFAARFGMSDADLATAQAWLSSQGFSVTGVSPNRLGISFSGTAGQVAAAFGTSLHYYRSPTETEAHFAPASDLTLPAALASVVSGVRHLSNFRLKPRAVLGQPVAVKPNYTFAPKDQHFLVPADVATIYNVKAAYNAGYTGAGQTIAVLGQSAIVSSDMTNFQTAAGLTVKAPTLTLVPGTGTSTINPGNNPASGDEAESDIDLEYSGGIAPGATINFVYTGGALDSHGDPIYGIFDALSYAVQAKPPVGQVITLSYGECEFAATNGTNQVAGSGSDVAAIEVILQEAAAQGQTFVNSSGDTGSTACAGDFGNSGLTPTELGYEQMLNVSYPASSAYAVGVGGTEFPAADVAANNTTYWASASTSNVIGSALSYIPEQVWNDDSTTPFASGNSLGNYLSAGGGGISTLFARPSWQTGVATTAAAYRLVPDVSLAASPSYPGYLFCSSDSQSTGVSGSCASGFLTTTGYAEIGGGTSFAAPLFAGLVAIVNQYLNDTAGQGLVTSKLYTLAANSTTYASAFHDVTSGGNECTVGVSLCGSGNQNSLYTAGTGYDMASGLGSPNFYNLMTAWGPAGGSTSTKSFTVAATPTALTLAAGSSGTSTITVTPAGGYTGTVAWTITSSPSITNACYTLPSAVVTGTTAATATLTIQTSSTSCTSGTSFMARLGAGNIASASAPQQPSHSRLPEGIALTGLLVTGYFGRRSRKLKGLVAMGLLMVGGLSLTGCSGGTSNNSGGTTTITTTNATKNVYTLTIKGTDTTTSTITASTTLTLTVD